MTQSEIAARTGSPLGTVKTRVRTAMQSLRQISGMTEQHANPEDLDLYALGALDGEEKQAFEAHLRACPPAGSSSPRRGSARRCWDWLPLRWLRRPQSSRR